MDKENKNIEEIINKKLMNAMWTILLTSVCFYIMILIILIIFVKDQTIFGIICGIATIMFLISGFIALKFEVDAGYYECKNCHTKFIPRYKNVFFSVHMGTTRYLKCPKCNKRSFSKKVMTK